MKGLYICTIESKKISLPKYIKMDNKQILLGKTQPELKQLIKTLGLPGYTASQITEWMYKKKARSFDMMTNISKKNRAVLSDNFLIGGKPPEKVSVSKDGTKKYLFPTLKGQYIESAFIPDKNRATLCISSQVGCKMGCHFCMTGKQGFQANLSAGEILNQIINLPESDSLTNIVYMGMGEPFDNTANVLRSAEILSAPYGLEMSPRRITVSTIGIIPGMIEFLEKSDCHLAISLHTPFEKERIDLMPVARRYSIRDIIDTVKKYDFSGQRRISFEYIMFSGMNDTIRHIKELTRLLRHIPCRINLISFHNIPGVPFKASDEAKMQWFGDELNARGVLTTIRRSRGRDIDAACGLLSTKKQAG